MVLPGLFGTFLEGRLAITAWMLAWTALGVALILDPDGTKPAEEL
jgi:hypothetical protein